MNSEDNKVEMIGGPVNSIDFAWSDDQADLTVYWWQNVNLLTIKKE